MLTLFFPQIFAIPHFLVSLLRHRFGFFVSAFSHFLSCSISFSSNTVSLFLLFSLCDRVLRDRKPDLLPGSGERMCAFNAGVFKLFSWGAKTGNLKRPLGLDVCGGL